MSDLFCQPFLDKKMQEEGTLLAPKFGADGLITAVVSDVKSGALLMLAHMNDEALRLTLETGIAHYWSRSRSKLWKKGESSGNMQKIHSIHVDCDQDAIWLKVHVEGHGATCHTGRESCFYRRVDVDNGQAKLVIDGGTPIFNPDDVYKG